MSLTFEEEPSRHYVEHRISGIKEHSGYYVEYRIERNKEVMKSGIIIPEML